MSLLVSTIWEILTSSSLSYFSINVFVSFFMFPPCSINTLLVYYISESMINLVLFRTFRCLISHIHMYKKPIDNFFVNTVCILQWLKQNQRSVCCRFIQARQTSVVATVSHMYLNCHKFQMIFDKFSLGGFLQGAHVSMRFLAAV